MSNYRDSKGFDLPCPNCEANVKISLNEALKGKEVICRKCNTHIKLTPDSSAASAERALNNLDKTLKKLGN
ncbi:MAG: hypothetical protein HWE24_17725 [Oceanospirillaceae bacterium]|nr:hypothetical protein [Oceanospirillaceae bacterium]